MARLSRVYQIMLKYLAGSQNSYSTESGENGHSKKFSIWLFYHQLATTEKQEIFPENFSMEPCFNK